MEDSRDEPAQVVARVCAIDVGKVGLVACVRVPHPTDPGRRTQEVRAYATVMPALLALADWLRVERVELVVMEATSAYWKPVFYLLEAEGFSIGARRRRVEDANPQIRTVRPIACIGEPHSAEAGEPHGDRHRQR